MLITLCVLLLVGCSQTPKKPAAPLTHAQKPQQEQIGKNHQQQLASLNHWQAEGRLAAAQGQKGGNASFVWTQKGDNYQIKLFGPFGSGAIHILGNSKYVELKEANGKITKAQSPEMLLKKIAGWQVPLSGLRYWMRGIPAPIGQSHAQTYNDKGMLMRFVQQGWTVDYEGYQDSASLPLPNKLRLQNGNVRVKMIVTSWTPLAA
jgi:outer membrane lipoprotein LolB